MSRMGVPSKSHMKLQKTMNGVVDRFMGGNPFFCHKELYNPESFAQFRAEMEKMREETGEDILDESFKWQKGVPHTWRSKYKTTDRD